MKKFTLNYIIDILAGISFLITAISALVLYFVPRGTAEFLGIARRTWSEIHTYAGLICIALIAIHMLLHLKTLLVMTKTVFTKRKD